MKEMIDKGGDTMISPPFPHDIHRLIHIIHQMYKNAAKSDTNRDCTHFLDSIYCLD